MSSINGINPQSSILQQIMDDARLHGHGGGHKQRVKQAGPEEEPAKPNPVSYTHLTLPTILRV
mgnify:CR=1 FL=1